MKKIKVAIGTKGCKTNQAESIMLEEGLSEFVEIVPFSEKSDVYIINSCTVTQRADKDSRALLWRAMKKNPFAKIIFTGCSSNPIISEENKRIIFLNNEGKKEIINKVKEIAKIKNENYEEEKCDFLFRKINKIKSLPSNHTRPFIKIQDGCNHFCSYCIVPFVRGKPKSLPPQIVIETIKKYEEIGAKEVVLTGVHLGEYGIDIDEKINLLSLLQMIEKNNFSLRIRISSIEPQEINDDLIDFLSRNTKLFCPHFHIPLQSGDNEILKKMRRRYTREEFLELVIKINNKFDSPAIGIDLIAGFPQEEERNFLNTIEFVQILPITYLHGFSYSKRAKTLASKMNGQILEKEKKERTKALIKIGNEKRIAFYKKFLGKESTVLIETKKDKKSGVLKGISERYIPFIFEDKTELYNTLVIARGVNLSNGKIKGEIISIIKR